MDNTNREQFAFILKQESGLTWFLDKKRGRLIAQYSPSRGDSTNEYEFYVGNPPAESNKNHELFVAICEFAVFLKLLRPVRMYGTIT